VTLALFVMPGQAQTETPAPTVTPTSTTLTELPLTSGAQLVIERRFTYGEIAIVIAVAVLTLVVIILGMIWLVRSWLR
jgi:hypothetical protein